MPDQNIDVDRVIEDMEAVPQTRERRMILALAYEIRSLKGGSKKAAGQKGGKGQKADPAGGQQGADQGGGEQGDAGNTQG